MRGVESAGRVRGGERGAEDRIRKLVSRREDKKTQAAGDAPPAAPHPPTAPHRLWFTVHSVLLLGVAKADDPRHSAVHAGLPALQALAWAGAVAGFFFVPQSAVVGWAHFARLLAALYLIFQLLICVEWAFSINAALLDKGWGAVLIAGTALVTAAGCAGVGLLAWRYAPRGGCSLNAALIALACVLGVAMAALSVTETRPPAAGLFTAASLWAYLVYVSWTALASLPPSAKCYPSSAPTPTGLRVASLLVTVAALGYTALSSASSGAAAVSLSGGAGSDPDATRPSFFHAVFACAACYVAMIFTAWEMHPSSTAAAATVDVGWAPFWLKAATVLLGGALYCFAMVAPAVFPDRDFS